MKNSKLNLIILLVLICTVQTKSYGQGAWDTGGNLLTGAGVLGGSTNFEIFFQTNNINRSKLNQTVNYDINGFNAARDGYLWLGPDAPLAGGGSYYNNKGAFSLLHLNGTTTAAAIELGFRPWMKTGITFTENSDMMYVGRKSVSEDETDAVISWSDDEAGPPFSGPDNMLFLFTKGDASGISNPDGDLTGNSMNGREVMRLTAIGRIGIGPRFDNDNQPKSTLHQHQENFSDTWYQVTNQAMTAPGNQTGPTAINATNGLRIGINGNESQQVNGNALIYNQENRHLLFSTGENTDASDIGNGNTLERMRITSIFAPTNTPAGGYGTYNPAFLPGNITRVGISHSSGEALTRPLSLLHLGYNVGTSLDPTSLHGWRHWMDIGMLSTNGSDNLYVGLKAEEEDKFDAVINWGDDQDTLAQDNLRFIFTSTDGGTGDAASQSIAGKEVGRFTPTGEFGIGNFYTNGLDEQPTERLDVDGTGRFRIMERDTTVEVIITGVKADTINGDYVLHYEFADSLDLGCEWNEVTNGLNDDLVMGYIDACNEGRVGIGVSNPGTSKLRVFQETPTGSMNWGTSSFAYGAASPVFGVYGYSQTIDDGNSNMHNIIGTAGIARSSHCLHEVIGVYGAAGANESCNGSWAGYFNGNVHATGSITQNSDESLKQNIEDIEGGLEIINQLQPRTYEFIPDVHEGLNLATGLQYGLVAQELEEVVPAIVKDVNHLAQYDSLGNMTAPPVSLKAVNYNALIPILIAGMKEQQAIIESQNEALAQVMDQIENLQQQINNCCSAEGALPKSFGIGDDATTETSSVFGKNELHQNTPNPFRSQTTISYTLEQGGKVILNIFDKTGKPITTLVEAEQAGGTYRYEWDASGLPAGLYHYALYVDGDLLVKKAIKLAD